MKKFLNILGSIFVFILIFGGLPLMSKEGAHIGTVGPIIFYLLGAVFCFWGAQKHENSKL